MRKYRKAIYAAILAALLATAAGCGSKSDGQQADAGIDTDNVKGTEVENKTEAGTENTGASQNENQSTADETTAAVNEPEKEESGTTAAVNEPENEEGGSITMAFTGDIFFSDRLYGYYQQDGVSGFLSENVKNNLYNSDLYIADHEFVCSDRGEMVDYQLYWYRAPSNREVIFKDMGADIVTLANNHTLDYGVTALQDTFSLLAGLGIDYVGAGNNLQEALKPAIKEAGGKRIAVFGASRFVPRVEWYATDTRPGLLTTYETTDRYGMLCDAIKKAKETCDYVVVFVHFGVENQHTVEDFQKQVAHGYVDSGADLVVGCHPHVLQGIEFYNGKPIAYSLGNFLFENYHSDTVVLNVNINEDNTSSVSILPCSSSMYKTADVTGEEAERLLDFMESISMNVEIDENGSVTPR